jgi:hypothetical protein
MEGGPRGPENTAAKAEEMLNRLLERAREMREEHGLDDAAAKQQIPAYGSLMAFAGHARRQLNQFKETGEFDQDKINGLKVNIASRLRQFNRDLKPQALPTDTAFEPVPKNPDATPEGVEKNDPAAVLRRARAAQRTVNRLQFSDFISAEKKETLRAANENVDLVIENGGDALQALQNLETIIEGIHTPTLHAYEQLSSLADYPHISPEDRETAKAMFDNYLRTNEEERPFEVQAQALTNFQTFVSQTIEAHDGAHPPKVKAGHEQVVPAAQDTEVETSTDDYPNDNIFVEDGIDETIPPTPKSSSTFVPTPVDSVETALDNEEQAVLFARANTKQAASTAPAVDSEPTQPDDAASVETTTKDEEDAQSQPTPTSEPVLATGSATETTETNSVDYEGLAEYAQHQNTEAGQDGADNPVVDLEPRREALQKVFAERDQQQAQYEADKAPKPEPEPSSDVEPAPVTEPDTRSEQTPGQQLETLRSNILAYDAEFKDALRNFYTEHYNTGGIVGGARQLKRFFGAQPEVSEEVQQLAVRVQQARKAYSDASRQFANERDFNKNPIGGGINQAGERMTASEHEARLEQVLQRYYRRLDLQQGVRPVQEVIDIEKEAIAGTPQAESMQRIQEVMAKYRNTFGIGRIALYGSVGLATGGFGTGVLLAARAAAGTVGGIAGGTVANRLYSRLGTEKAQANLVETVDTVSVSSLNFEDILDRQQKIRAAYDNLDTHLRNQELAGIAGAIVGGGTASVGTGMVFQAGAESASASVPVATVETPTTPGVGELDVGQITTPEAEMAAPPQESPTAITPQENLSELQVETEPAPVPETDTVTPPEAQPESTPALETAEAETPSETVPEREAEPVPESEPEVIPAPAENLLDLPDVVHTVTEADRGLTYVLAERYPDIFPTEGSPDWQPFVNAIRGNEALLAEAQFPSENIDHIVPGNEFRADVFAEYYLNEIASPEARAAYAAAHPDTAAILDFSPAPDGEALGATATSAAELNLETTASQANYTGDIPEPTPANFTPEPRPELESIESPEANVSVGEAVQLVNPIVERAMESFTQWPEAVRSELNLFTGYTLSDIRAELTSWVAEQNISDPAAINEHFNELVARTILPDLLAEQPDTLLANWDTPFTELSPATVDTFNSVVTELGERFGVYVEGLSPDTITLGKNLTELVESIDVTRPEFIEQLRSVPNN